MASIERRGNNSYRITVSAGYDITGKKLRKHKTVTLDPKLTSKQIEKELNRQAVDFESQVSTGHVLDDNITLKDFTDLWLEKYASIELQPKTVASYKMELDSKILPAIGHIIPS